MRKIVQIDQLAAEFALDSKSIVDRLRELEATNQLQGIIDDRGKFVSLTEDELLAVKRYIEAKGRVSRAALSLESNRLIRLQPTAEHQQLLLQEERNLIESLQNDN